MFTKKAKPIAQIHLPYSKIHFNLKDSGLSRNLDLAYPVGLLPSAIKALGKAFGEIADRYFPAQRIYLICTGSSGALIAGAMACFIDIEEIIYIHKSNENHHSNCDEHLQMLVNSPQNAIIFVDDFISTGSTFARVLNHIHEKNKSLSLDAVMVTRVVNDYQLTQPMYKDCTIPYLFCAES
jgi:phosphoribosylpyrophosphate synthetase